MALLEPISCFRQMWGYTQDSVLVYHRAAQQYTHTGFLGDNFYTKLKPNVIRM